ncbi:MAG: hypothetical protein ABL866_04035 [Devosia sp.]
MCVRYGCTICGATAFEQALRAGALQDVPRDITARGWTSATLQALARALAALETVHPSNQESVRSITMLLHRMHGETAFTDEYAPGFSTSPAHEVLESMRQHHTKRLARGAEHDHRNSPEGIAEARARRKAAAEQRAAQHHARKAARDAARPRLVSMPLFACYVGIDYSGAKTSTDGLRGLRVCMSAGGSPPHEVLPPPSPKKYWTRRGVAEWLVSILGEDTPTLVGIDHGFSFPKQYFEAYGVKGDWSAFLDDFHLHWPTDEDHTYVDDVRDGIVGNGEARLGKTRWRRLTEQRAGAAKSVFHFDVTGSVAKSTHSGLPWLRFLRRELGTRVHFWPFDGWDIPSGKSAIVEVYPALWSGNYPRLDRTPDQHDAFSVAAALSEADRAGTLKGLLAPEISESERSIAGLEGWILGVSGPTPIVPTGSVGAARPTPRDVELNREMVKLGLAWAFRRYSDRYASDEALAEAQRKGIWQAPTEDPWTYRSRRWEVGLQTSPPGCPIKGNISNAGRVYHTPWSPWYDRTKVSLEQGERWFCSEREALDAGWRAPLWGN